MLNSIILQGKYEREGKGHYVVNTQKRVDEYGLRVNEPVKIMFEPIDDRVVKQLGDPEEGEVLRIIGSLKYIPPFGTLQSRHYIRAEHIERPENV